jgi:type III restriction enzyme
MKPFSDYKTLLKFGNIDQNIPTSIKDNLNPIFELRPYQKEALAFFKFHVDKQLSDNTHLLYNMATGSGKTLLMASNILYLYEKGYRNFIFFVNNTNILEKTKDNFLNFLSTKYLLAEKIVVNEKEIQLKAVDNFDFVNNDDINIVFATVQGLHSNLNNPRENSVTYEDFKDEKVVLISDEAHHINAMTKKKLNKTEKTDLNSWEHTVNQIYRSNSQNILLEFTATANLDNPAVKEKYENKVLYQYSLKEFRKDGFSKEVEVLQADLEQIDRAIQAVILSQYRLKIAEKNGLLIKPVILMKSKTIIESQVFELEFKELMEKLTSAKLDEIKNKVVDDPIKRAFDYFDANGITLNNLVKELKEDFSEAKCLSINTKNESEEKQIAVNSLESPNNEIRAIFAVDKLNEGWDVLNLFDIVRLYETRDSRGKPGKTTVSEAQLIGRGARYFPFRISETDEKYKRKYDEDIENELRIIETLYYHSSYNPKYIYELHQALVETGIIPDKKVEKDLIVKDNFKTSSFWKKGTVLLNKREKNTRKEVHGIKDMNIQKTYLYKLFTGRTRESALFGDSRTPGLEIRSENYKLLSFGENIIKKAINKLDFYYFSNLSNFFPNLTSISEFIASDNYLGQLTVDVSGSEDYVNDLSAKEKLEISIYVLKKISKTVKTETKDYKGTKIFYAHGICDIIKDKKIKVTVAEGTDQERGFSMKEPQSHPELYMDLNKKDWYVYNDNYGTSEEKFLTKFINDNIQRLKEKFDEVYLVRNEKLFQIYRFSDGLAFEPDFVLFLNKESSDQIFYQLFIEPKGEHLIEKDKWKEEFLKEIENEYELHLLHENESFKLFGMPFFNENLRKEEFKEKLELIITP